MMMSRTAQQCGHADYGWLQARYTFSFGHYFDPKLLGYASLRVLNQEVLAPGAAFQPRTYPQVDILNLILQGEAEYRDSEGNYSRAASGEALLLATQPGVTYSELNVSKEAPLTRIQLWLDACPTRENPLVQQMSLGKEETHQLIASPDGEKAVCRCVSRSGYIIFSWRPANAGSSRCGARAPGCNRSTALFRR